jgi:glycosyltransferase involved in cell wall biosynthesis
MDEPFGLALIEALYYGNPVFGTTYGSLPELITNEVGYLSNSKQELAEAAKNWDSYNKSLCRDYAISNFCISICAKNYIQLYERILNGDTINETEPGRIDSISTNFSFK